MKPAATTLFLTTEAALWLSFVLWEGTAHPQPGVWLKYMGILLCLAFSLECARRGGDPWVYPALALTALADSMLMAAGGWYFLGVLLFLAVQLVYMGRLGWWGRGAPVLLRLAVPLPLVLALLLLGQLKALYVLAVLYYPQLLVNAALAWSLPGARRRLFALGLALFAFCDLCVGLSNSPALVPGLLAALARGLVWPVYLPSQILITLSALPLKEVSHHAQQAVHPSAIPADGAHPAHRRHCRPHPVPPLLLHADRPPGAGGENRADRDGDPRRL